MNSCYEYMQRDLEFQLKTRGIIEARLKALKKYEDKYLTMHEVNGNKYYYKCANKDKKKKQTYLGKEDEGEVVLMQEHRYLVIALKRCDENIKCLERAIKKYRSIDPREVMNAQGNAYKDNPNVGNSIFRNTNKSEWRDKGLAERIKYDDDRPFKDALVLRTASGELVRTRGEIIIADTLDSYGLTYVYEWPKMISGTLRWPDFTVLHPKTKEEITIEYMGRYDDPGYREKNNPRMEEFFSEGYILGQNLLVFMDDADGIIDSNKIHRIIRAFFVD